MHDGPNCHRNSSHTMNGPFLHVQYKYVGVLTALVLNETAVTVWGGRDSLDCLLTCLNGYAVAGILPAPLFGGSQVAKLVSCFEGHSHRPCVQPLVECEELPAAAIDQKVFSP